MAAFQRDGRLCHAKPFGNEADQRVVGLAVDRRGGEADFQGVAVQADHFGFFRTGLDVKTRELLTFSMLLALGGCEPQLKGHIQGNANIGNDKQTLLSVVTQLLPYVGYPRALNALRCINEVLPE